MPKVSHVYYPFDSNLFTVTLFERGNAPDYSIVYGPGVQAGRGFSEGYQLKNCPKCDDIASVEITGNDGTDMMRFNYIKIDFGKTGDGVKWYFVDKKTILNYPSRINGGLLHYTMQYDLRLDYWETYKDRIGTPDITLTKVTTNNPEGWEDLTALTENYPTMTAEMIKCTERNYFDWKTIVGWQAKKPDENDLWIMDGMATTLQFDEAAGGNGLKDFWDKLKDLATGSPEETNIWKTYVCCNCYVVPSFFTTEKGGNSDNDSLSLTVSFWDGHNRLNYYPYRRAFLCTVDGQRYELDYNKFIKFKIPETVKADIYNSTLPTPTSTIVPFYDTSYQGDAIIFKSYPTSDLVGRDITPVGQVFETAGKYMTDSKIGSLPKI